MTDILMTTAVVLVLAVVTAVLASRAVRELRVWIWVGLVEYLLCSLYQYFHGADANGYRGWGMQIAFFMDQNFSWAAREAFALLIHEPSAFDDLVVGAGTNTGSMSAASAFIIFCVAGSGAAAQALVAGCAFFGALGIHGAFRDAWPTAKPFHLFFATVLFPSVAFWVAALHKEAMCLMGMGLLMKAWRAMYRGRVFPAILLGLPGFTLVAAFRAPVLAPLFLGFSVHFVLDRIRRGGRRVSAGRQAAYLVGGIVIFSLGALAIGRVAPEFGIGQIRESVTGQQVAWQHTADQTGLGGSAFGTDEPIVQSTGQQIASAPMAMINALFRPQFFDVRNAVQFVSAVEMTTITVILVLGFRRLGLRGAIARIRSSPFFVMCALVTVIGGTFLGITTRNFGTLARYRVPFLPFYGVVLAGLLERRPEEAPAQGARLPARRGPLRPRRAFRAPVRTRV